MIACIHLRAAVESLGGKDGIEVALLCCQDPSSPRTRSTAVVVSCIAPTISY